jgi:hypothetical protein
MPERIQRKRINGWRMPEGAVYVGRGSKWGNPYKVLIAPKGMVGAYPMTDNRYAVLDTRPEAPRGNYKLFMTFHDAARYAVEQYRYVWFDRQALDLSELAGHDLACWCAPGSTCHADYLLAQANPAPLAAIES